MKKIFLILSLFTLFLFTGCDSKKTMEIVLEGNPTTGYEWTYEMSSNDILKETRKEYLQNTNNEIVGAGGLYYFDFEALKEGSITLTFNYARSWETEVEPINQIVYTFKVDKNKKIELQKITGNYFDEQRIPEPKIK